MTFKPAQLPASIYPTCANDETTDLTGLADEFLKQNLHSNVNTNFTDVLQRH